MSINMGKDSISGKSQLPSLDLLNRQEPSVATENVEVKKKRIAEVFHAYKIEVQEIDVTIGPSVSLYEIKPYLGTNYKKIRLCEDDIAISLGNPNLRFIIPIPGKMTIGIEIPNENAVNVPLGTVLSSKEFQETQMQLPCAIGKTIQNEVFMFDLTKTPHLLLSGSSGQGKTACLNTIICSLLYKKKSSELQFVLIDPKKVEFSIYNPLINHFLAKVPYEDASPIVTDITNIVSTLNSLCNLMDSRYDQLKEVGARNIKEYNEMFINKQSSVGRYDYMPYIVVIIDEFGDLMMTVGKEVEQPIVRIAQLARAVGIHMIISTQRPSTSIITGYIKANFPARIAFRVSDRFDSKTIIDCGGAECLNGNGDMLVRLDSLDPVRIQGAYIEDKEIERIVSYIAKQGRYDSSKTSDITTCTE